ncbi:MAG: hypothetical protein ACRD9Y_21645 [Blastocatellia bacterium]
MKKQILNVVITLSVIATLSIAVFAGVSIKLTANVPFDFMVNGKTLPAGHYTVEQGNTQNTLVIRNLETKQAVGAITQNCEVGAGSKPQLIFRRYGNQYFLAQVIGDANGSELPKSKAEREAAKAGRDNLAMNAEPEIVKVSAQIGQ